MLSSHVLVLNKSYIPVKIISAKDAIISLFTDKAVVIVEDDNKIIASPSIKIKLPKVIVQKHGDYFNKKVVFSKLNVVYRDNQTCGYCGKQFRVSDLTIDHVIPKSRWKEIYPERPYVECGKWENLIAACRTCNTKKGNRLLSELHWKMHNKPYEPEYMPHLVITRKKAEMSGWLPFCGYNVRLIETIE